MSNEATYAGSWLGGTAPKRQRMSRASRGLDLPFERSRT